jgi:hypothetical protein
MKSSSLTVLTVMFTLLLRVHGHIVAWHKGAILLVFIVLSTCFHSAFLPMIIQECIA